MTTVDGAVIVCQRAIHRDLKQLLPENLTIVDVSLILIISYTYAFNIWPLVHCRRTSKYTTENTCKYTIEHTREYTSILVSILESILVGMLVFKHYSKGFAMYLPKMLV